MTKEAEMKWLARTVAGKVRAAFQDPVFQAEYEKWYAERYKEHDRKQNNREPV